MEPYIDEEVALGFHVWVAELELLVGTAKGRQIDQVAAFELLQKLLVTITTNDVARVREYQRRCEMALMDILLRGAAPPVRRLVSQCLVQLYVVGDSLPMYARVSGLQSFLGAKEALSRSVPEPTRAAALQCLAALCQRHGRVLASSMSESLAIAIKHTAKGSEPQVRCQALQLIASVVTGLGPGDRTTGPVQADSLKCALKAAREHTDSETRMAAAGILRAIAQAGGAALWAGGASGYEEVVRLSVGMLDDDNRGVASSFASALGDLAAASRSSAAQEAVKALEKKAGRKAALEKVLKEAFAACLVVPFVEAAALVRRRSCTALAQSWLVYLAASQKEEAASEAGLVDLAVRALEMLAQVGAGVGTTGEEGEPELGWGLASGEMPHVQACILYILRVGVIEQLGEQGQRAMLERLLALLASVLGAHVPLAVASLEAMGLLLEVLGEIPADMLALLEGPVQAKLLAPSACLRRQAAALLAAMAVAEQSSAARLLEERLDELAESSVRMAAALGPEPAGPPTQASEGLPTGTPRGIGGPALAKLKPSMDAVHGNALGAAALLVATARLPLGVPDQLPMDALDLVERLTTHPRSQRAAGCAVEREAGYTLLGALCIALPVQVLLERRQGLLQFWHPALSAESAAQLDLKIYITSSLAKGEMALAMEVWWRAAALEALKAFILSPLLSALQSESGKLQRRLAIILQPTLEAVLASPILQDPHRAKGALAGAAALFQLRLLEVYLALPLLNAFASEHQALSKLCARAFRSNTPSTAPTGVALQAASATLRILLNRQDAVLGPWLAGRGPLDDALQAFAGSPGGPSHHPWEAGLPFSAGYAGTAIGGTGGGVQLERDYEPFPQPRSLGAALLERQLVLLGSLLAVVNEANQVQILDVMTAAAAGGPPKKREKEPQARRPAIVTSVCCAALAGLDSLARKYRGEVESRDAVAERARVLAEAALAEGARLNDATLQRSAAEMFALAACIGSDANALQLVQSLCTAMASTASAPRRAALALALGCVYRSKGGMALQGAVGLAANTLLAVARGSSGPTHLWLLHALWLLANAAGLAFIPNVKGVLALEMDLLMSEEVAALPGLRPALGRLANAMVAVLGPELSLGSAAYQKTRALLQNMQSVETGGTVAAEEATMAELERVLYAQMLILFAPHALPASAHLPLLLATLNSRQPALRKAAADTLRHLAERDPEAILPARIEGMLFVALDSETDTDSAAQLKATLRTLLAAGAPTRPSHYLLTCSQVALAASASPASTGPPVTPPRRSESLLEDDDEESDEEEGVRQEEARRESNSAASTSMQGGEQPTAPTVGAIRLRTRTFAAKCLLELPDLVGPDPCHVSAVVAQDGPPGDWLVGQLQTLVDVAFKLATGSVEALRPCGLKLLEALLRQFGDAEDPLMEGSRLLEQYQAQFVAALRSALSSCAGPSLAAAGAALAADFVRTGLADGDAGTLTRLLDMLTAPLTAWQTPRQEPYAEWVGVRARVALLEANAICAIHLLSKPDKAVASVVSKAHQKHSRLLMESWAAILADWVVLSTQPPEVQGAYRPRLFASPSPSVLTSVQHYLQRAWPAALAASCICLDPPTTAQGEDNEDGGEYGSAPLAEVDPEGYMLLVDVCQLALTQLAEPSDLMPINQPSGSAGDSLQAALTAVASLQQLLLPRFFRDQFCDLDLCIELAALLLQFLQKATAMAQSPGEDALREGNLSLLLHRTAKVISQICSASPDDYLMDAELLDTLAAALVRCLDAAHSLSSREEVAPASEAGAATEIALLAAARLLDRAPEGAARAIRPGLLTAALNALQSAQQGNSIAAAQGLVLAASQRASVIERSPHPSAAGHRPAENGLSSGTASPPDNATVLAATANVVAQLLAKLVGMPDASADRIGPILSLTVRLGGLIPAAQQPASNDYPRQLAEHGGIAAQGSGDEREDWGEEGYQDAAKGEEGEGAESSSPAVDGGETADPERRPAEDSAEGASEGGAADSEDWDEGAFQEAGSTGTEEPTEDAGATSRGEEQATSEPPPREGASDTALEEKEHEDGDPDGDSASPGEQGAWREPSSGEGRLNADGCKVSKADDGLPERIHVNASGSLTEEQGEGGEVGAADESTEAREQDASWQNGGGDDVLQSQQQLQAAQELCLQALEATVGSPSLSTRALALQAVRSLFQECASSDPGYQSLAWSLKCLSRLAPLAAAELRAQLRKHHGEDLATEELLVAAETLKLLHAGLPLAARAQPSAEEAIAGLLAPMLVVCAAPDEGIAPHPVLRELVSRLLPLVAAGPSAAAFKAALGALSVRSRLRLQAALQASAASHQPQQRQEAKRPGIALKNFASFKPPE